MICIVWSRLSGSIWCWMWSVWVVMIFVRSWSVMFVICGLRLVKGWVFFFLLRIGRRMFFFYSGFSLVFIVGIVVVKDGFLVIRSFLSLKLC